MDMDDGQCKFPDVANPHEQIEHHDGIDTAGHGKE
jgi:hypothetical protein